MTVRVVLGGGDADESVALAHALRRAGAEVVYLGPDQPPERVVAAAIDEDAAAVTHVGGDVIALAELADVQIEVIAADGIVQWVRDRT